MAYLNYSEYISMGGTLNESAFNGYCIDAESKLNYLTNNRIKKLDTIPDTVKRLEFKIIALYATLDTSNANSNAGLMQTQAVASYSNGIESFSYDNSNSKGSSSIDNTIHSIILEYLSEYPELLYRGRSQWKQRP